MASPRQIGAYSILGELGRGSMGVVYRVRKGDVQRELALKVIASSRLANPVARERFRREAKLLAKIRHPGVIRVHDAGEEGGILWYVMDVVEGESLEDRVAKRGPLSEADAGVLLRKVAEAVAAIHDEGIVHRDLKPANVLLAKADGEPLIADFGLARELESEEQRLTRTGFSVGTPTYMSPEQVRAQRDVDARADVYALGGILYYALTGREPFVCPSLEELVRQILEVAPRPPSEVAKATSVAMDRCCLHALSKERAARPRDARVFAAELATVPASRARTRDLRLARAGLYSLVGALLVLLVGAPFYARARTERELAADALAREEARAEAQRLAEANKQRVANLVVSVRAQLAEGDDEEGLKGAREALRRAPDDPVVLAVFGAALIPSFYEKKPDHEARHAGAVRAIGRALELAPRHPTVLLAHAKLLSYQHGKEREPVKPLLRDVLARGDRRDRLEAVSQWLLAVGPEEQEPLLDVADACLKDAPSWAHAHFVRGQVLDSLHRTKDARAAYDRCLELAPKHVLARRARAYDAERLEDYKSACTDWEFLLKTSPDSYDLHFLLGIAKEGSGDREAALREYERAVELWPAEYFCPVYMRRGKLLYKLEAWERAASDLERATKTYNLTDELRLLADCYSRLGRPKSARETWSRILAIERDNPQTVLEAGAAREKDESLEASLVFYRASLEHLSAGRRGPVEARIKQITVDLAKVRADESTRRLKDIKEELEAIKKLADDSAEKKRRADALQKRLDDLDAYQKETARLLQQP